MPNDKDLKNNNIQDDQVEPEAVEEALEELPEDVKEVLGFSENDEVVKATSKDKPTITPDLDYISAEEQAALDEIDKLI